MCGFASIFSLSDHGKTQLPKIYDCLPGISHRGPDGQKTVIRDSWAMAHARLSIIDLSDASSQPFFSIDQNFVVVYNGELFNYKELRKELNDEGVTFDTNGDVEVLLKMFIRYGESFLQKLQGFFSFVIYNQIENKVFAARDRFGVKPFYFYLNHDILACASEVRGLLPLIPHPKLEFSSLLKYFRLSYLPEDSSALQNVEKLKPATFLSMENGHCTSKKYFHIVAVNNTRSIDNEEERFLELLKKSIQRRITGDVAVGSFLSGGLDSSVVTALLSEMVPNLQTFSLGHGNGSFYDESKYAEIVAKKFNTTHHTFVMDENEAEEVLNDFFTHIDEPFADASAFNLFYLARKTKEFVKVVLSGDGADELLAGYNKHRAEWVIRNNVVKRTAFATLGNLAQFLNKSRDSYFLNKIRQLSRFAEGAKGNPRTRYEFWASFMTAPYLTKLLKPEKLKEISQPLYITDYSEIVGNDFNSFLLADFQLVLPSDMLVKVDRMSMANGLEVRNPFLDPDLVNFVFSLPASSKINSSGQKLLLRKIAKNYLPPEIINRPKTGFETPIRKWMNGPLENKITELCLNKKFIDEQGLFNYDEIERMVKRVREKNSNADSYGLWALLVFNSWYRKIFIR